MLDVYFYGDLNTAARDMGALLARADTAAALAALAGGEIPVAGADLHAMVRLGLIRLEGGGPRLAFPFFVERDAPALALADDFARAAADSLWSEGDYLRRWATPLAPGFTPGRVLYHLLGDTILDGLAFEYLGGMVSTGMPQSCGETYLPVAFWRCAALEDMSAGLLCSSNNLTAEGVTMNSFGDGVGDRHDMFRLHRMAVQGRRHPMLGDTAWVFIRQNDAPRRLALELKARLAGHPGRDSDALALLAQVGYVDNQDRVAVPVFGPTTGRAARELAGSVMSRVIPHFEAYLDNTARRRQLEALRQGIPSEQIANELWHQFFGRLCGHLCRLGLMEAPVPHAGAGRYHICLWLE